MAKAKMSIWGHGHIWNIDVVKTTKEMEQLCDQIDDGSWDYETYGEPEDGALESGVNIGLGATIAVEDAKGKTIFEIAVGDLPYSCFEHEYRLMSEIAKSCHFKKYAGIWFYSETAKGEFFTLDEVSIPKEGIDPKKFRVSLEHLLVGEGEEVYCHISNIAYDGHYFEEDTGTVVFKGGGSLSVY